MAGCQFPGFSSAWLRLKLKTKIGPDVINKFTLILLNKNPKIYESIIRMGDWS